MEEDPPILRPRPRRPFRTRIIPASPSPSSTPALSASQPESPNTTENPVNHDNLDSPEYARSYSNLNLTASTLFGIYAPTSYEANSEETPSPWGTRAQSPARDVSVDAIRRQLNSTLRSQSEGIAQSSRSNEPNPPNSGVNKPQPARRRSSIQTLRASIVPVVSRLLTLFAFGVAYGLLVSKLHENRQVAPVQVEGIRRGRGYLAFWGMAGVGLGSLLPWVDWIWAEDTEVIGKQRARVERDPVTNKKDGAAQRRASSTSSEKHAGQSSDALGADWNLVVRSVGAFIGIAFAIRKTPWQSTLQVSLTLALVNPVLWYLLDRSKPGFILSTIVGLIGTAILLGINPDVVPSPAPHVTYPSLSSSISRAFSRTAYSHATGSITNNSALGPDGPFAGLTSNESIGVATWIASVLFCSSICFGNIGRKLALKGPKLGNA